MMYTKKRRHSNGTNKVKRLFNSMTEIQKGLMLDFISSHPQMIRSRSVGGPGPSCPDRDALWDKLASILNSCESGAQKDGAGWRRSWNDMKRYECLKAAEAMSKSSKALNGVSDPHALKLSPLQDRIASLLSEVIQEESITETEGSRKSDFADPTIQDISSGGDDDNSMATALQNIAQALAERNTIEEKKLKVYEKFLSLYEVTGSVTPTLFIPKTTKQ